MRILVTGCLGTLGRPLVRELRDRGHEVWGCDLRHDHDPQVIRADVAEHRQLQRAFGAARPEVVYHLAAEFGRHNGRDYPEQLWRTNVLGTRHVIDFCRTWRSKLIFASSSEIYGELPTDGEPIHEHVALTQALRPTNDYAVSKLTNELQCRNAMADQPIMVLRFFNAYGPGEYYHPYRSVVALFCYRLMHGLPVTVYRGYHRVFMYIDDFIPTLATACTKFEPGACINVGGTEYRSVEDLVRIVAETINPDHSLIRYAEIDEHNIQNKRPSIDQARRLFGHEPQVSLELGVPATVAWMRMAYSQEPAWVQQP